MKLIWEQYPAGNRDGRQNLRASLVDHLNGSETVVAHLGSIEMRFLNVKITTTREFHQGLFWAHVDSKLKRLGVGPAEKSAIEAQISEKVPRPGDDWSMWAVTCIPRFDK